PPSKSGTSSPPSNAKPSASPAASGPASWQAVTLADIDRDLVFDHLPPDAGIVTPIASVDEPPDPEVADELEELRRLLPEWPLARVSDPVQRVRNLLYVAAVPDVQQVPLERHIASVVYERLKADIPRDTLIKILYWIALHPEAGEDPAPAELEALGISPGARD